MFLGFMLGWIFVVVNSRTLVNPFKFLRMWLYTPHIIIHFTTVSKNWIKKWKTLSIRILIFQKDPLNFHYASKESKILQKTAKFCFKSLKNFWWIIADDKGWKQSLKPVPCFNVFKKIWKSAMVFLKIIWNVTCKMPQRGYEIY